MPIILGVNNSITHKMCLRNEKEDVCLSERWKYDIKIILGTGTLIDKGCQKGGKDYCEEYFTICNNVHGNTINSQWWYIKNAFDQTAQGIATKYHNIPTV